MAANSTNDGAKRAMGITADKNALHAPKALANAHNWKQLAKWNGEGFYELRTEDTRDLPVRMFLTPRLLEQAEDILYRQSIETCRTTGSQDIRIWGLGKAMRRDIPKGYWKCQSSIRSIETSLKR